ncbi:MULTISPECIES: hypothetical protein [Thalassospira]|uniref:Uncharacterized protein n=2 Tax=Thalassospira TaxID=168934 RepID=A0A367WBI8_9PROT|nr:MULTISPECIES: hypothetical protein [Thalassospira]MDG4717799.1 hypothetical protein [Thalassospira sp. FZY0004]RCK38747.1 hypothetical protein TH19_02760 [Thalassospira profundimaris]
MQKLIYLVIVLLIDISPALAEPVSLTDYLLTMDRTAVQFSGRIKYDSREREFTFYDNNRDPFGVTVDAGRDDRERIEAECDNPSFIVSYSELCTISGRGTVEIRGSRVYISIEKIDQLSK